ncbi:hypothetical protein [Candidatus Formimonas warabiya]|uniref:hypothetical protein n=1 Tax=Formimonas warabiya TaxID=1761012 RepID=UPI001BE43C67|nr:hypothetical protein [Candidatus Formimonas warabiya]
MKRQTRAKEMAIRKIGTCFAKTCQYQKHFSLVVLKEGIHEKYFTAGIMMKQEGEKM